MLSLGLGLGITKGGINGYPSWLLQASTGEFPSLDIDFQKDQAWNGSEVAISSVLDCTRASDENELDSLGVLKNFTSNALPYTNLGLSCPESRTNVVLHNRDLTNAAWTKTNTTAAKDQTGIDGTSNGASSLTATADNGTCLQSITLASSARYQSAFLKRLVGTGTIEMTMDGGSTWTDVTSSVGASWAAVEIATQTIANPNVGFRLGTNGDSIAVDAVQNENGTFRTSPIFTTTAAATRAANAISISSSAATTAGLTFTRGTWYVDWTDFAGPVGTAATLIGMRQDANSVIQIYRQSGNSIVCPLIAEVSTQAFLATLNSVVKNTPYKGIAAYETDSIAGAVTASLNSSVMTDSSATLPSGSFTAYIGADSAAATPANSIIRRVTWWPYRLSNTALDALRA